MGVKKVRDIDFNSYRPKRGGVVPVVDFFGEKFYCFGVDYRYNEITDFGGGISYRKDGSALQGALREFQEESLGVFSPINPARLWDSDIVKGNDTMIIFYEYDYLDIPDLLKRFQAKASQERHLEVSALVWFSKEEAKKLLSEGEFVCPQMYSYGTSLGSERKYIMYEKIRLLLSNSSYFS